MPISGYFFDKFDLLTCLLESVQVKGYVHVYELQPYSQMIQMCFLCFNKG